MNILIGLLTACLILFLYCYIEKVSLREIKIISIFFLLFTIFCSYMYKPSQSLLWWLAFSPLFYTSFDDLRTKTLDIRIPLIVTLIFFLIQQNPYNFFLSFLTFAFFLAFSLITREKIIAQGDAYVFLPLSLFVGHEWILGTLYLSLLLGIILSTIEKVFTKQEEHAFAPFFVLGSMIIASNFHTTAFALGATLSMIPSALLLLWLAKKKN